MTESNWCSVCGGNLDAQGKCPRGGHSSGVPQKLILVPPVALKGRGIMMRGGKRQKCIVEAMKANKAGELVKASEYLAYAFQFAMMGYSGDAVDHVSIALGILSELGAGLDKEDLEPMMKPLKEIQRDMPSPEIASRVSDAQEELELIAAMLVKGGG